MRGVESKRRDGLLTTAAGERTGVWLQVVIKIECELGQRSDGITFRVWQRQTAGGSEDRGPTLVQQYTYGYGYETGEMNKACRDRIVGIVWSTRRWEVVVGDRF